MDDLSFQTSFVADSAWRLLSFIDTDPLSPTHGCAHLAYWRDKTSDVSDARRQESMLPLALLYTNNYPGSSWRHDERLRQAVESLLYFWIKMRYHDGSLDEWYKGERAYAAAAFTTYAVSRTLDIMQDKLPSNLLSSARNALHGTAKWLSGRNDLFKTNHQAVGVGALAWAGYVLDTPEFTRNARAKLDSIISTQTPEGWFPEVGKADPGYTFLTVEYVAMAMRLWNDFSQVSPFLRAFDFATQWVHPDLVLGEEYGICRNPYVSRISSILLSGIHQPAAVLRHAFATRTADRHGLAATLADDLRLPRWAFQPLTAYDYHIDTPSPEAVSDASLPLASPDPTLHNYPRAGLTRLCVDGKAVLVAACAGGMVRMFGPDKTELSEYGYAICDEAHATSFGYRPAAAPVLECGAVVVESALCKVTKFMPSYVSRVILRMICSTALGSRLARKGIDLIRRRKGTALNQSSPSLATSSPWTLRRSVSSEGNTLSMVDKLVFSEPVQSSSLYLVHSHYGSMMLVPMNDIAPGLPERLATLTVTRIFMPQPEWRCISIATS